MSADGWDDLSARIALSTLVEPGDAELGGAVRTFGAGEVVRALQAGCGPDVGCARVGGGWDPRRAEAAVAAETMRVAAASARLIAPDMDSWPGQLDDLGDRAPILLRSLGPVDLRLAASRSVAIVGSRSCTAYGASVAEGMAAGLADAGWCVVSGAAFGIDASGHRGAIAAGGLSIAVSAGGADLPIPAGNQQIFDRLWDEGCVVSEVPLGARPGRHLFLVRNRVIAALARAVVVVEAGDRSGAARTVSEGHRLGRVVGAVPGPVTSDRSVGCHRLLRDHGAVLVRDASDVIDMLQPMGVPPSMSHWAAAVGTALRGAEAHEPVAVEELVRRCEVGEDIVLPALIELREAGRARQIVGGWVPVSAPS